QRLDARRRRGRRLRARRQGLIAACERSTDNCLEASLVADMSLIYHSVQQHRTSRTAASPGRTSMPVSRRTLLKSAAGLGALSVAGEFPMPAVAQAKPVRIGILAPRSGIAAAPGENGIRATQWAVERFNAGGGIAGRKIELVIAEESTPKDTI